MRLFKTSFFWQFAGGFVLGAAGLFALQPADVGVTTQATTAQTAPIAR